MFEITESAREELKHIVEIQNMEEGQFLRLATPPVWIGDGDFGVVIDKPGDDDMVVDHEGETVLLVDPGLAEHLAKSVMDFKDSRFSLDVY
jgi:Fe-S cluster assembly iron-binding protein IscA